MNQITVYFDMRLHLENCIHGRWEVAKRICMLEAWLWAMLSSCVFREGKIRRKRTERLQNIRPALFASPHLTRLGFFWIHPLANEVLHLYPWWVCLDEPWPALLQIPLSSQLVLEPQLGPELTPSTETSFYSSDIASQYIESAKTSKTYSHWLWGDKISI